MGIDTMRSRPTFITIFFAWVAFYCMLSRISIADSEFDATAASVFAKRCIECHNPIERSGELDLTRRENAMHGGSSGKPWMPGSSSQSLVMDRILSGEMPPEKNGKSQRLSETEANLIRQWIDGGAAWPEERILDLYDRTNEVRAGRDWWSLQPLQIRLPNEAQTAQGAASSETSPSHPIDSFIVAKLSDHGMIPALPASKRVLLRRLYHDLIGLPPTAEEIEAFEKDDSPDAFATRVDALLARPQFGERWARHWLDVVRYADTNGYERDAEKKHAWRYRDWVVQAMNQDMPFDRFLVHQLAGDEIPDRNEASVIATGFLRLGTWDDEPNDPQEYQYDRLEDLVHVTSTAFMALTVKCARCHDHKFDPIYQTDYYRIGAAFWAGPVAHRDRAWNGGPTSKELGFDVLGWTDITSTPKPLHALKKGDIHRPMQAVSAGPLSCCKELDRPFEPTPIRTESLLPSTNNEPSSKTTRQRFQLAQWMVRPEHPLTARVIVNRLWQHHFGEGIVRTPDNFGFNGAKPTHPELLDWLAHELIAHDWSLKHIHRLMVTSRTYQQSSQHESSESYAARDASNGLLWRANRRRLDAESLRDAILVAAGQLDHAIGGPSFKAPIDQEALEGLSMKGQAYQASPLRETQRRSLYMFHKRGLMVPFMTTFDLCDSTVPTGRRDATVVPTQALAMLNNAWVHEQSLAMSARLFATDASSPARIDALWRNALGRSPTNHESQLALEYIETQQRNSTQVRENTQPATALRYWASLCHILLNTNEFITID
jgi:hypothetical protein